MQSISELRKRLYLIRQYLKSGEEHGKQSSHLKSRNILAFFGRFPFCRSWSDFLLVILCFGVFAALFFTWTINQPLIFRGSPYEAWDECMGYTEATRMSLTARYDHATYGSIEEFKFRIAKFIYKHFDPVGKHVSPRRWSNNVLQSYSNPSALFESPSFDGNYARGILDRRPFIIARYVNSIGGLILAAGLCCFWLVRYRYTALFLIVPLLWFLVSIGYLEQAETVTPNAWNTLLTIMLFASLIETIQQRTPVGLYISAVLLGFGANEKIDFLFLGAPVFVTWIVAGLEAGTWYRRWIRPALVCVLLFLAALIVTNPRLLYALPLAINEQLRLLDQVRESGSAGVAYNNLILFREFLTECLGAPWDVTRFYSLSVVTVLAVCLLFPLSVIFSSNLGTRRKLSIVLVLITFYVSLWLMPLLLAGDPYDRYFLSGSGIAMISAGYACRYFWGNRSRFSRALALIVICTCLVFCSAQAEHLRLIGINIKKQLDDDGLDKSVTRNQAISKILKLIESGNYNKQVIIDQHSYTDVRPFLEKGIPVILVNVFNYQGEFEKIQHAVKPTLGLYVVGRGEATEEWVEKWNDEERFLYERYLRYLSGFETLAKFGDHPMFLLDWGPVDPTDEVVVFETKPAPSSEVRPE